ncbi:sensor histidine kinase [Arcobacter porcinus]|uniref:histidine kinase n=1 Tax=Arcobacter porcinus TaxID=1935204 RepID=A0A5C2HGT1_9BACT|nr:HAMP domain-containing sensor histidine kinase [Arcobacter porcinus]OCL90156.1 putative sensor-like histidine kinase YedV [Aliarcobacter thereius]QEP41344.1 two-component system sensor histidine kinase [Arcobacter porcinus]
MKLPKSSTMLFFNILIFLNIIIAGYIIIYENLKLNNEKNQEILFFQIKEKSSSLLTKILQKYHNKKYFIKNKHKEALKLYRDGEDIDDIKTFLDSNNKENFEIYILNEDFEIVDSSNFSDIGFSLNLLKKQFLKYLENSDIGVTIPEFSHEHLKFISYSISKLDDNRYFKMSYNYKGLSEDLKEIQDLIKSEKTIKTSIAYIKSGDYIGNFAFKSIPSYKQTIKELEGRLKKSDEISTLLGDKTFITFHKEEEGIQYHVYNSIQTSAIYNDANILYCIVFDDNSFFRNVLYLKAVSFLAFIIGASAISLTYNLRNTELLLNYKDKFIAHSIHEINTPLSIITINTQLREKLYGSDKYSLKINGALRTLENSYEDMTFLHTKDKIEYELVDNNLLKALESRVKYFDTIAQSQNRSIEIIADNTLFLKMGKIELNRLIDNNISNAIKYSLMGSTIKVYLKGNVLEFHSVGQKIENPKNIFIKYKREDKTTGGHGLGLAIVSDICKKYDFRIEVESREVNIFRYILGEDTLKDEE